jgi:hypothetical protein
MPADRNQLGIEAPAERCVRWPGRAHRPAPGRASNRTRECARRPEPRPRPTPRTGHDQVAAPCVDLLPRPHRLGHHPGRCVHRRRRCNSAGRRLGCRRLRPAFARARARSAADLPPRISSGIPQASASAFSRSLALLKADQLETMSAYALERSTSRSGMGKGPSRFEVHHQQACRASTREPRPCGRLERGIEFRGRLNAVFRRRIETSIMRPLSSMARRAAPCWRWQGVRRHDSPEKPSSGASSRIAVIGGIVSFRGREGMGTLTMPILPRRRRRRQVPSASGLAAQGSGRQPGGSSIHLPGRPGIKCVGALRRSPGSRGGSRSSVPVEQT